MSNNSSFEQAGDKAQQPMDSAPLALDDQMLKTVSAYLESQGWRVLVISPDRVQGPVGGTFNYELVLRFTGTPSETRHEPATNDATKGYSRQHPSSPDKSAT